MVCLTCGRECQGEFVYCPFCGSPLVAGPVGGREERKVVTVVFCDLVGFTARAEQLDPEDVKAVLLPYHEKVRSELVRFGGTVEKFIGDAVMAVFGAPLAHDDDPERALRAALAIRDWASDEGIELRVGVNTGEAVVTMEGEPLAAGDVVNTAARLQAAAAPGGVLVGETTRRATRDAIEYREHPPVSAKGKANPLPVWEAVQPRSGVKVERGRRGPLVGRRRELSLLRETLERAHGERELQLVTLVGVPGIGKSRLVYELYRMIEQGQQLVYWRYGRSLPYGEGVAFFALSEIVKAQAGILETDGRERAEDKLRASVRAVVADEDVALLERQLRPLIGFGAAVEEVDRRADAFAAWRRFLEAMAERRPLVVVFEDLHWADDATLDFVDHLIDWARGVPMLVLATARPELLERRPAWGGGKSNAATISLAPLDDEETATLTHALLEASALSAERQSELLARAGGNPLYAEEFARLFAEGRSLDDLPETVQGLIAARVDALSAEEKQLLESASVFGKVFWLGAVAAVAEMTRWAAEEHLHALERKEFVRRERRTSVAGEVEYGFRHVLVGDVAYSQLPRSRRAEFHCRAAAWIESLGQSEAWAEVLAHHYFTALELLRAAGHSDEILVGRASIAAREAGNRALTLNAFSAATRFYSQALSLTPPGAPERAELLLQLGRSLHYLADPSAEQILEEASCELRAAHQPERAAEAHVVLAELWWDRGKRDNAFAETEHAVSLIGSRDSSARARIIAGLARQQLLAGEESDAICSARDALAVCERLELDDIRSHVLDSLGSARVRLGDSGGIADIEEAIELALVTGSHLAAVAYNNLAVAHMLVGDVRRASDLLGKSRRQAELFGDERMLRFLRGKPEIPYLDGRWADALRQADAFVAECDERPHYLEGLVRTIRAVIALARDDLDAAAADMLRAEQLTAETKDPQTVLPVLAARLRIELDLGRIDQAAGVADELLRLDYSAAVVQSPAVVLAWAVEPLGIATEVRDWIRSGRIQSRWDDAAVAILERRFNDAADAFHVIGSIPDAAYTYLQAAQAGDRTHLERALSFYASVGAARYLHQAESLLIASA